MTQYVISRKSGDSTRWKIEANGRITSPPQGYATQANAEAEARRRASPGDVVVIKKGANGQFRESTVVR